MSVFAGLALPKTIYKTESKYNGVIEVLDKNGELSIRVGGFTQSVSKNTVTASKRIWGKTVELIKTQFPEPTSVLVLGLGGGTMQHFLADAFSGVNITSVEIDPEMIDVAQKFFDVDKIPNHTIVNGDAYRVVIEPETFGFSPQMFDVAIVDSFFGDKVSKLGSSGNFLAGLKRLMSPGGLVVFNRIYLQRHQADVDDFAELIENFFINVDSQTVAGYTNSDNILIYGRA